MNTQIFSQYVTRLMNDGRPEARRAARAAILEYDDALENAADVSEFLKRAEAARESLRPWLPDLRAV